MTSWFLQKSLPPAGNSEGIRTPARNHQERSPENTYYRGGDLSCSQKLIPTSSTDERQGTFFKKSLQRFGPYKSVYNGYEEHLATNTVRMPRFLVYQS